jgi:hypothetical protein
LFEGSEPCTDIDVPALDSPEAIGYLYESSLSREPRKRSGSFYTPTRLVEGVVSAALAGRDGDKELRVCDPAMGAGAFLIGVGRRLVQSDQPAERRRVAERCLFGVDISPLAAAVAEACIWLWVCDPDFSPRALRQNLFVADAVGGFDCSEAFRDALGSGGFDLVIGNPPWVAYAGRAAKPLSPETRRRYSDEYACFRGYPTLHGLFVEQAARLAPNGVVALLLPSPIADLDGYRPVRNVLSRTHTPREPLIELGQDAFEGVTQPCFVLVADPTPDPRGGEREWRLVERQRAQGVAEEVAVPAVLERVFERASFPRELFGELGFQSAGEVSRTLFLRADAPDAEHVVPLLEGRDVSEFRQGAPRLFLKPDPEALARSRCRLRPPERYRAASFVVRQTAKMPIAALHAGLPFRNTLLAGYSADGISAELAVALLNSVLYRALHLARRRDARQAAFPQVKVRHLRALPRPPESAERWRRLEALTRTATERGVTPEIRGELDREVFDLFEIGATDRQAITEFVTRRTTTTR